MSIAQTIISRILEGDLQYRSQGYMLIVPRGCRLEGLIEAALLRSYGSAMHPDIRRLTPGGAGDSIKVDDVRSAQDFLSSTPSGDKMKTAVFYRADRMNDSAANALLKPLEEPTRHTRLILVTDDPAALPATIRSRCSVHVIAADPALARSEISMRAAQEDSPPKEKDLDALLHLADGNPHLALEINRFGLKDWISKLEKWLSGEDKTPPMPALAGKAAVPRITAVMCIQSLMMRLSRQETSLKGWSPERAIVAAWCGME